MKRIWLILREAAECWFDDNASRLAAALAFYTLLSLAPLAVIATAIAGAVFGKDAATGALAAQLNETIGAAGAELVSGMVKQANRTQAGIIATIIGVITLLFGASSVFYELQAALNTVWNIKPKAGRRRIWALVCGRFLTFLMVLVCGLLLLISLISTTILAAFEGHLGGLVPGLPALLNASNFILSFLVIALLFAMIFKILPLARIFWRDVWFGAFITSGLFTIGKYLISVYLGTAAVATPFGAAGSLVVFIVWIYYSGMILLFGAELTKVTAKRAGRMLKPADDADLNEP